jgi:hypothetical protein
MQEVRSIAADLTMPRTCAIGCHLPISSLKGYSCFRERTYPASKCLLANNRSKFPGRSRLLSTRSQVVFEPGSGRPQRKFRQSNR